MKWILLSAATVKPLSPDCRIQGFGRAQQGSHYLDRKQGLVMEWRRSLQSVHSSDVWPASYSESPWHQLLAGDGLVCAIRVRGGAGEKVHRLTPETILERSLRPQASHRVERSHQRPPTSLLIIATLFCWLRVHIHSASSGTVLLENTRQRSVCLGAVPSFKVFTLLLGGLCP